MAGIKRCSVRPLNCGPNGITGSEEGIIIFRTGKNYQ
jgi:hypothetical protein